MYDISDRQSFEKIDHLIDTFHKYSLSNAVTLLCANKQEVGESKEAVVSRKEGKEKADQISATFFEVSTHSGINVVKAINWLLKNLNQNNQHFN